MIRKQVRPALIVFLLITLITGVLYPLVITGIAQAIFPVQANGNLIYHDGRVAGSALIGQPFTSPKYFWGRLSATSVVPYNSAVSSGSNLGPTNPALIEKVNARVDALHAADPGNTRPFRSISSLLREAASILKSASLQRTTRSPALPANGT